MDRSESREVPVLVIIMPLWPSTVVLIPFFVILFMAYPR